jgi:choice-of-anchor C domain-containing protein
MGMTSANSQREQYWSNQKRTMNTRISKYAGVSWVFVFGAMFILPLAASASLNLVQDGGFEEGTAMGAFSIYDTSINPTMGGWTVSFGSVNLIRDYWTSAEGKQSVDMAGFPANDGEIQQTISGLIVGQQYLLSFDMAGNPVGGDAIKHLRVTFGSLDKTFEFDVTGRTTSDMGWVPIVAYILADSSTMTLTFRDYATEFGSALDNVALVAVPETSTAVAGALLLLPFGASAFRALRRKHAA